MTDHDAVTLPLDPLQRTILNAVKNNDGGYTIPALIDVVAVAVDNSKDEIRDAVWMLLDWHLIRPDKHWHVRIVEPRQHTLTPCARCGNADRPGHMVPVGDDRLCVGCAGAEIGRLREIVGILTPVVQMYASGFHGSRLATDALDMVKGEHAALGKEQP